MISCRHASSQVAVVESASAFTTRGVPTVPKMCTNEARREIVGFQLQIPVISSSRTKSVGMAPGVRVVWCTIGCSCSLPMFIDAIEKAHLLRDQR